MEQTGLFLDNGHIMKKITTTLLTLLLLFTFFAIPARISADQTNTQQDEQVVEESVDYDLPFSGMLPDSPFYIIKKARDHVHIFFTRDHIKKSELLLQVADKKIVMAQELSLIHISICLLSILYQLCEQIITRTLVFYVRLFYHSLTFTL